MQWKLILSALLLMLGCSYLDAAAQVRVPVTPVPRAVVPRIVPRVALAAQRTYASDSLPGKLLGYISSQETPFWSERSVPIAAPCNGRFQLEGFKRELDGRAMFHGSSASKDALRTQQGTLFPLGAPTSYGLRISLNFGRSRSYSK